MTPIFLHTAACVIVVICGIFAMNSMNPRSPIYDALAWWCVTVGAFAHGILWPTPVIDYPHALLSVGIAMFAAMEVMPNFRRCIANRRNLAIEDKTPRSAL